MSSCRHRWIIGPVLALLALPASASAQNLRELAREQAQRNPGSTLEHTAPPADHLPKSIEELTKEADVVIEGKLSTHRSYLSPNADRVLTDYRILHPRVVSGHLTSASRPAPGAGAPLVLTVYGGEAVIEGIRIRATDNNREAIKEGGHYLLFLRASRSGEPGQYEIYYGGVFEILKDKVNPLLRDADRVFKPLDRDLGVLMRRIQKGAQRGRGI